jgi:hypothetical protein
LFGFCSIHVLMLVNILGDNSRKVNIFRTLGI